MIHEPFPVRVIRLALFGVLFLMAVVGNACVFTATLRNKKLQTFSYSLITCLSVADFTSVLGLPFTLVSSQLGSNWIFGSFLCTLLNPTQVMCGVVTTNVHMSVAVERYMSVIYPFKGKPKGKRKYAVLALIWITAVLCAMPAFLNNKVVIYNTNTGRTLNLCVEEFDSYKSRTIYSLFLLSVNYGTPVLIMAVLYARVILRLRQRSKLRHCMRRHSTNKRRQTIVERKFIKMTFMIMVLFVMCYLPYQIVFLLIHFDVVPGLAYGFLLYDYAYLVTWLPNAINPICYGAMDRYYAKAFRLALGCLMNRT
ncbi:predicted protein, partial [Nematostella vectensis]